MQNEIKTSHSLLNSSGSLNVSGWAGKPIFEYDRTEIKKQFFKVSEWDHYIIYNNDYALSMQVADHSLFGIAMVTLMDFRDKARGMFNSKVKLLPMGRFNMPGSPQSGDVNYDDKRLGIHFSRSANMRSIKSEFISFHDGKLLNVSISFERPDISTISVASGFPSSNNTFVYTHKDVGMSANGFVKYGSEEFAFSHADSYGVLDWGRGVLPRKNEWLWSSMSTKIDGKAFAINFGRGIGDNSQGLENMIFYDGKMYKISSLKVQASKQTDVQHIQFSTKDRNVHLVFTPFSSCTEQKRLLFTRLERRLIFGRFSGRVRLDENHELNINDHVGFTQLTHNIF